mmetsp:Transcript_32286/g.70453  ORF Transcript_32286/g.70453 Transcript_32286/m.70453 type:complete len:249 (-) Transcript_32286:338-1084(-)
MVVADDGTGLDTSTDQEVHKDRLHLGLPALEIVTGDERLELQSSVNHTRHKSVLGAAVDEGDALLDTGQRVQGGGGNLRLITVEGSLQVVVGVVKAHSDLGETLGVSGPEHDDLVDTVLLLELLHVLLDLRDLLRLGASDAVVRTGLLVSGHEVTVEDAGQRNHVLHVRLELALEIVLQHAGAGHSVRKVHLGDIPTADDDVVGVHAGHQVLEGHEHLLTVEVAHAAGGRLQQGAEVVGVLHSLGGPP